MSQSTGVAAAPGVVGGRRLPRNPDPHPATAPPAAPAGYGALTASVRRGLAGTPGRMRVVAALAVVVTLAFGLGAGQAFRSASGALERAGANAAQVVRVQEIRTNLVRADAAATNAFLVGGSSPRTSAPSTTRPSPGGRRWSPQAARAQPADGAALAAAEHRPGRPTRGRGAGPGQQPSGPTRGRAVPHGGQRRPARRAAPSRSSRSRERQRRPGADRVRCRRTGPLGSPCPGSSPSSCSAARWSGWPGAPTATSTSGSPAPRSPSWSGWSPAGWCWEVSRRGSSRCAPARTPPPWPRRRRGSRRTTPRPTSP